MEAVPRPTTLTPTPRSGAAAGTGCGCSQRLHLGRAGGGSTYMQAAGRQRPCWAGGRDGAWPST